MQQQYNKHYILSEHTEAEFVGSVQGSAQPSLLCSLFSFWCFVFVGVWSVVLSLGQGASLLEVWWGWVWVRRGCGQGLLEQVGPIFDYIRDR